MQKNQYNTDNQDLEKKIPDISGILTTTAFSIKLGEIEDKIPNTSGLAATLVKLTIKFLIYQLSQENSL